MTKEQASQITKKIKAYYYYFELDKDSQKIWIDKLLPYSFEDVDKKIEEHITGEERQNPPRVQDLIRFLLTEEQKAKSKDDYIVNCNLCGRQMTLKEYDNHYDRCLSIEYLVNISKQKGQDITRKEIENCKEEVLNKLYEKYKPQETCYMPQKM